MKVFIPCLLLLASGASASPKLVSRDVLTINSGETSTLEFEDVIIQESGPAQIVNGTIPQPGAYPWFGRCKIDQYHPNGTAITPPQGATCGASLIHAQVAISAFHCVAEILEGQDVYVDIYFGASAKNGSDAIATRTVQKYFYFEDYDGVYNDIVLFYFDSPITEIDPIAFNRDANRPAVGSFATTMGFGETFYGSGASSVLYEVVIEIISYDECNELFGDDYSDSELICIIPGDYGQGPCRADSGGPLVADVGGEPTVFGVLSFGDYFTCGIYPVGYMATSHYQTTLIDEVLCNHIGDAAPSYCNGCSGFFCAIWNIILSIFETLFGAASRPEIGMHNIV